MQSDSCGRAHWWLPEALIRRYLCHWLTSDWSRGAQAAAEIAMVRHALVPEDTFSGDLVNILLKEPPEDGRNVRLGLAYIAAYLWRNSSARDTSTRILIELLAGATNEVAKAWASIFYGAGPLLPDEHTAQILAAVTSHPKVVSGSPGSLIERLGELLQVALSPERIAVLLVTLVNEYGNEVGDMRTTWHGSAEHIIDLSLTLQRLPETREQGMSVFEKLMDMDAYSIGNALFEIDRRMP